MKRRSFLSSILAAGMAPAIVRASSIMPIWVPSNRLFIVGADFNQGRDFTSIATLDRMEIGIWENVRFIESIRLTRDPFGEYGFIDRPKWVKDKP